MLCLGNAYYNMMTFSSQILFINKKVMSHCHNPAFTANRAKINITIKPTSNALFVK